MFKSIEVTLLLFRQKIRARIQKFIPRKFKKTPSKIPFLPDSWEHQEGIAVVAIIKDEETYLAEWLEFHLMLGVRHIFLYDNGSTDETPQVLAPYFKAGVTTLVPWRNFSTALNPQTTAYAHAIANFGMNFRWIAFIDVDEFLFPVSGNSLDETLKELSHLPVVSVPWICFGSSDHQTRPPGPVIANYTERAVFPPISKQYSLTRYKSIVDPREVENAGPHACTLRGRGTVHINEHGVEFPSHQNHDLRYATADKLRLNHYFTRSKEELQRKLAKGRVSKAGHINENVLDRRLKQFELAKARDTTILRFLPRLEARLAKRQGAPITVAE
jgi:glycosyltransferase involved in cell wall biosynthesis